MKLSAETHRELEEFFRVHLDEPGLRLPEIRVHAGPLARLLTALNGISGITFGRHVFVSPALVGRDAKGRPVLNGRLLVHEAAHVLQYERSGFVRFLRGYLRGYLSALRAGRSLGRAARNAAYLAIAEECEAREAADAYHQLKRG